MAKLDYFNLMRNFWDFAFENPELIKPNHCALFAFSVEHCNRLGWKNKFGLPASMVLDAIGIKSYSVYKKTFDELVEFGFIEVIEYSKNQHSSNVIALKENCKATYKAHSKATVKHIAKHVTTHGEHNKTINNKPFKTLKTDIPTWEEFFLYTKEKEPSVLESALKNKYDAWVENDWKNGNDKPIKNWKSAICHSLIYIEKEKSSAKKENLVGRQTAETVSSNASGWDKLKT